jgi:hypothetical protein
VPLLAINLDGVWLTASAPGMPMDTLYAL